MEPSVFVISITPFDAEGRLDETALRAHLDRMADAGVGVYLGGGGSGEGFTLTPEEARRVLEIGVDQIGGRVPVRAMGIEPRTAEQMIDYLDVAAGAGVDAAQIYSLDPGHGHRPSPEEVETYLRTVLEATTLPCVVSSHQSVGYKVRPRLLGELADEHEHLVGVNCSHGDVGALVALCDTVGGRLSIHVGGPMQGLTALSLGAQGYLSSEANLAPRLCATVIDAHRRGDLAAAFDAFGQVVRLSGLLYGHGGIRATKAVLDRLGLPGGTVRLPQLTVSDEVVDAIVEHLDAAGIPAIEGWVG
ncbi:dihydrodipicolinate synthase family protein [Rhabdothermincola salaria]|uniref:dihydrodipicolinate synthase family protein n=1 Tax=Rhabdothermincola salaria TaxID=2903142 RepID=UPI001E4A7575|nr:dihydrodipicolinate synthase family protein [Rhabdothermincola salaria]MCD9623803.1 dihydrodipicolinate synthase family protein [Rhabdothermincola salaria]